MTVPYFLRTTTAEDEAFLQEMLYLAIFVPVGHAQPPRSILQEPSIAHYVSEWGRTGDYGVVAMLQDSLEAVGAAWFRCFPQDDPGYGFVDAATPEVGIAVRPKHRKKGVGAMMLANLITEARARQLNLSLSCDPANPAWTFYQRFGFEQIGQTRTMIKRLV